MKDVNILTNNGVNVEQSLELFGDMEMYDETLQDFLNLVEDKLNNLEKYKTNSDMPNYAIEVHSLKSDAKYLGFTTLADLSYQSEMKSKAGDVMFVQENHGNVINEARRMINVAKQYMGLAPVGPVEAPTQAPAAAPAMPAVAPVQTPVQPAVEPTMPAQAQPQVQYYSQQTVTPTQTVQYYNQPVPTPQPIPTQVQAPMPEPMMAQPIQYTQPVETPAPAAPAEPLVQFFPADNTNAYAQAPAQPQMQNTGVMGGGQAATTAGPKLGTILIVDDSNLVVNFVKKIFDSSYNVLVANDGLKAIELIDQEEVRKDIKAVLLDLNMPVADGFVALEHFKEKGYFTKIPVAIESGAEDMESIDRANQYPIVDILSKPFNERDVQRVIEKCLAVYF